MIAILLSLSFGGDTVRQPNVSDIKGEIYVYRGNTKLTANKRMGIKSGDIIKSGKESSVRLYIDKDKYVVIEENSSAILYFTEVSNKGSIEVSISEGSVICQINDKLKKDSEFKVKTPNSVIDVRGTVFRTSFKLADTYMGYEDVYITEVQNFSGTINLQLYNIDKEPTDLPMILIERTSAKMITCSETSQYIYLNHDTDMFKLPERTMVELLRISTNKDLAYSTEELNSIYKTILRKMTDTTLSTEEITEIITVPSGSNAGITKAPSDTSVPNANTTTQTEISTSKTTKTETSTLATTRETHVYTTYSGDKWWEITNSGATDIPVWNDIPEEDDEIDIDYDFE